MPEIELDEMCGVVIGVGILLQPEIKGNLKAAGLSDSQIYCQRIYMQYTEIYEKIYSANWEESRGGYFQRYCSLDDIGKKWGMDKSSKDHNYLDKYEFFLNKWKYEKVILMELGVYKGGSLDTWAEYFKNGIIYGVDIDEKCLQYEGGRKHVIIQDLGDEAGLEKLGEVKPDIIIDDATVSVYEFCEALAKLINSGTYIEDKDLKNSLVCLKEEITYLALQIEMIVFIHDSCIMVKK